MRMNVGDIITRPLLTIPPGATLIDAAKVMVENNLGLLVICDAEDKTKVAGVISERDIIKSIVSGKLLNAPVAEVSTKHVVTVKANSEVA